MGDKLKLLVIEDELTDFQVLERELRGQGVLADCTLVRNHEELVACIDSDGWDAVLSDFHVPGVEFRDTLSLVQSRDPLLPVILVTGTVGEQEAVELLKEGAWDFLLKDRPARLSAVIERTLREAEERRKRAAVEEALRAREALLDAFFTASPAGLAVLDLDGRHVRVNEALAQYNGLSRDAHLGKFVHDVIPKLGDRMAQIIRSVVDTGEPVLDLEMEGETPRHPGQNASWVVSHFPIPGANGTVSAVGVFVTDITARKRAEEALKDSEARARELLHQNRRLTQRTFRVLEKERRHLAREMHDEMGQWLTAIQAEAEAIRIGCDRGTDSQAYSSAEAISHCASQVQLVIRRLVGELRPALLDALGLEDSLRELVSQWSRHHAGVACALDISGELDGLDEHLNITLYRIIQEALTNVAKHAKATRVSIHVEGTRDEVRLSVENDGQGIPAEMPIKGMGLLSMRERAVGLGGCFNLLTPADEGVRIEVCLPSRVPPHEDRP